ncbi:uncharacterized protein LOC123527672 isoform X2 [Mercenaria mercenaria]|uniref:uncharacterized protein LOC123527672 isoform X2 n=1 Tax=Mercenaria mercenaria TaxID=6596 RepID=UPI00234F3708|nr:uncharacterized protein LOC123527672 isoform X2 [Mercenaria mercenaria]
MSNPKISFAFSLIATFFGSIALFSNYWFQGPYWNAGFIEGCALDVCVSTQSIFSWNGDKVGSVLKKYYVLGIIGLIFLPLVMIAIAAALKGVSLYCPSESRGVSATVCAWIAAQERL